MKNKTLKKELITILIASLIFVTGLGIGRLCSYAATAGADGVVTSEASRALEETTAAVQPEEEKTVVSAAKLPVRPGPGTPVSETQTADEPQTGPAALTADPAATPETAAAAMPETTAAAAATPGASASAAQEVQQMPGTTAPAVQTPAGSSLTASENAASVQTPAASSFQAQMPAAKKAEKYTPISTVKTDPYTWFGPGRLTMLANHDTGAQNLSVIIETGNGGMIVVDGGWEANGESLLREIKRRGGHVAAWLITHPHQDHALALAYILQHHASELTIDGIYYNFFPDDWYAAMDQESVPVIQALKAGFAKLPASKLHGDVSAGQVITAGQALVQVLNNPYQHSTNCGNNSCVTYMVSLNGTNVVFLGDLGLAGGASMMDDVDLKSLKCDMVQVAHHGQTAVSYSFYQQLAPKVFLWPTPQWLWDNDNGGGPGSGNWQTGQTRKWQTGLLISEYYCTKDGDQVIE